MADGAETAELCQQEDLNDVATLLSKVEQLHRSNQQLQKEKKILEDEFGKKRAVFRELYVSREEELKKEREVNKLAREDVARMKAEMEKVTAESYGFKAAAAFSENDQQEQIIAIHSKYQEEIASLHHIMKEAIVEARHASAQQYELEQRNLIAKNQKLERQVQDLKELLGRSPEEGSKVHNVLSAVTEAVTKRRNIGPGGSQPDVATLKEGERKQLEVSMKKAQENAEAWRAVVLPLEEEILSLKSKLKDAEERIQTTDTKLKLMEKDAEVGASESGKSDVDSGKAQASVEELEEKVKDLTQYLESERSSRTDLEMYVSVLNTQKGVLQEDSEKLRKELQNVCRLLEQEKTAHMELKQTWQMANNQFLEVQRIQDIEYRRLYSLLEVEQKQRLQEMKKQGVTSADEADVGPLIDLGSTGSSPGTPNSKLQGTTPPLDFSSGSSSQWDSIDTVPCTNTVNSLQSPGHGIQERESDRAYSDTESDKKTESLRRAHSASDVSLEGLDVSGTEVARAKSADNVLGPLNMPSGASTPDDVPDSGSFLVTTGDQVSAGNASKMHGGRIDWKVFQEEVKFSHEERSCAMCVNYETQLQNVQGEKQKYHNLANNLQKELEQEKKALFNEQRLRTKLEEAVTNSAEDAQSQINAQTASAVKLEKLLISLQENFESTKQEAYTQIAKLLKSRDALEVELEKLRADYGALQDSALQQLTQMESDSRIAEMKDQLLQIRAVSESTEESLRNEILFLKDRAMAEQVEKDSLEEMFQSEVDSMKKEIVSLKAELQNEKKSRNEVASQLAKAEQSLRNIETKSKEVIVALRKEVDEAMEEKGKVEEECHKFKNQLQSLTQQLNESEQNQRDFVKLSQSLQMQIAQIQESQTEVRWEHEDDVSKCRKCQQPFRTNKEKYHCEHCGKIFCKNCLSKTISSGVNQRLHRVCESCYAALSKDAKSTYFNTTLADENR